MITELADFVQDLQPSVFYYNIHLEEGLYFEIDIKDDSEPIIVNQEAYGIKLKEDSVERKSRKKGEQDEKPKELSEFLEKCKRLQTVSKHEFEVNRSFNSSEKIFIQTASPFALGFNKKAIEEKIRDRAKLQKALEGYFKRSKDFVEPENQQHIDWLAKFQRFCTGKILDWIRNEDAYAKAPDKTVIRIFYAAPEFEDFQTVYNKYVEANALDKDNSFPTELSKFTDQKIFMAHQSAPFKINFKVSTEVGKTIWQFFQLRKRILPNPLPIFIDKKELNGKMVAVINEDRTISYSQMLKKLFEEAPKGDLGSYYLLFFVKGEIRDLDFVPSFRYNLTNMHITEVFSLGNNMGGRISNIFEFENKIVSKIFDSVLVSVYGSGGKSIRYFSDLNDSKSNEVKSIRKFVEDVVKKDYSTVASLVLAHRQSFYDFIYKSRQQAIQSYQFHELMSKTILDDIQYDKEFDKDYSIKEKLNIWFSLYDYFNPSQSNQPDMINKTKNMITRMQEIVKEEGDEVFQSDDEFAFASGQLIRYLLSKNESSNRSHALLEPFLQKTEPTLFKFTVARTFDTYKHALGFYKGNQRYAFDKLMSIVMGYEPQPGTNMKDYLPMILAGYFSKLVFYSDDQTDNTDNTITHA